ncbi:IclR family transcriptional regulator [Natronolimnohabitans innermongolicus]|uniref:IclR family transcriptional regulator n=1 Tax=Natronolimnohabitans innermongolicus JCM 12255 TaxID=1227499 RepID=L9WMG5_9EURY|nr:IclR family transcriptional regulator [Natronolimnohabitans innermongolicus]ELY50421.1 IclR family transcriptional regulator [Natronolimnohabitans innermongolicus JCM 12255]
MAENQDRGRVKTTETAFRIVELLMERDGMRLSELARELGVAKSTAHRHLSTLLDLEYVTENNGVYRTGLRFLEIGEQTRTRTDAYRLAEEKVADLAAETEERSQFIVEEHGQGVYLFRETGDRAVHTDSEIGKRIPIHATAAGKAILANLSDERIEEIIDQRGLPALTEHTTTDEEALWTELAEIRDRGYSTNDQENTSGLRAIGVPVRYEDGEPLGALSVSGPTHRFQKTLFNETLPNLLLGTANELELNIQYS